MKQNRGSQKEAQKGVPINLISKESIAGFDSEERVTFVLEEVKQGKVLILEMGLSAVEEANLIEQTMRQIDHETFIGIEIQSYSKAFPRVDEGTWLDRLLKRKKTPRMAVIGPASLLRTIHKDGNVIQTMLVTREHVIEDNPADLKEIARAEEEDGSAVEEIIQNEGDEAEATGDSGEMETQGSFGRGIIGMGSDMEEASVAEGGN